MRDRERARIAHQHVSRLLDRDESIRKKYATFVHKMPALISSAGLCQAVHFIQSRNQDAGNEYLGHLTAQLQHVDKTLKDPSTLADRVRGAPLDMYLRLTQEAFLCSAWYRRMVQGVLKIEASDVDGDNG